VKDIKALEETKEWRSCKLINPKYLKHVTCSWIGVDIAEFMATCKYCDCNKCICARIERNNWNTTTSVIIAVGITISVISTVLAVLRIILS
jgi:hypothetical protein